MLIKDKGNVIILSDLHIPAHHRGALDFVKKTRDKFKCDVVVGIGDMIDFHAISYHEADPDGLSIGKELDETTKEINRWKKEFPKIYQIVGNHTNLPYRKAKTHGLSKRMIKSINEVFDLPKEWVWDEEFEKDEIRYQHGTGKSGKYAYLQWAVDNMQSTITGHLHSHAGLGYTASNKQLVYGMGVGCLIDRHNYAMQYGKEFAKKPILSCGVVLNNGDLPMFIPMNMN